MATLHVTNGGHAVATLRAAGLDGDVVAWDDVLHEGPVPGGVPPEELRVVRARFIAEGGRVAFEDVLASFSARDAALAAAFEAEEVVLWFEHDLYDQLQLCQVLDRLCCAWPRPRAMSLVCGAEYVAGMTPARVRERFAGRRPLTDTQAFIGRLVWGGFTAPDPAVLEAALATDTGALPFAAPAMRRHLQEFPWTTDGLSRTERQLLQALAGGPLPARAAYPRSHHAVEDPVFLGDSTWASIAERLGRATHPLLARGDGVPVAAPAGDDAGAFWDAALCLTDTGRAVLEGDADHVALNGVDRWLGGAHLTAAAHWRWDPAAGRTAPAP